MTLRKCYLNVIFILKRSKSLHLVKGVVDKENGAVYASFEEGQNSTGLVDIMAVDLMSSAVLYNYSWVLITVLTCLYAGGMC